MSLFAELKRRNVIRVTIAYLALAWLLTEVAGTLFPVFGIPVWGLRFIVIILTLGLIPTLVFSWAYEITPEGLKREKDVVRDASITNLTAKRLDGITIGLIVVALAFIMADRMWLSPKLAVQPAPAAEVVIDNVQVSKSEPQYPPNSIAVLPFVNMSSDPEQEYFSDGISEELLNLLSKISEMRVTSRSSAFSFKDKDLDLPTIATQLNVAYILEGSVRKAGNQVRITAQLIEAHTDTHLWSETYERTLNDIFTIQDEIASSVVTQLKITLLGEVPTAIETDPEAFSLYLLARQVGRQETSAAYKRSIELYQQALAIAPDFAAAWAGQASIYFQAAYFGSRQYDEAAELAYEAIDEALAINPDNAQAHALLGGIALFYESDLAMAAQHFQKSLELKPTDPDILAMAAFLVGDIGHLEESIAIREYVLGRDPVNPRSHFNLGISYLMAGHLDKAIASMRTVLTLSPKYVSCRYRIGVALLMKNEPDAALAEILKESRGAYRLFGLVMAYHALGQEAESDAKLKELIERYERVSAYNIAFVLAFRNEVDPAFEWLDKAVEFKDSGLSSIPFDDLFSNIRDDPRWIPFLESIGKSPRQLDAIRFRVTLPD